MKRSRALISLFLINAIVLPMAAFGQAVDVNSQIQKEGMENSKIMRTLHFLTDVYGPRLTGSPGHKAAAEWAAKEMTSWGFANATLEPWDFGSPGWVSDRASGFITAPVRDSLVFEVLAWTPGTERPVTAQAFHLLLPERPTQEELTAYFNSIRDQVKGKIVLVGRAAAIPVNFNPPLKRLPSPTPTPAVTPTPVPTPPPPAPKPGQLNFGQIGTQLNEFLVASGVLVRVSDAGREHGQIRAF